MKIKHKIRMCVFGYALLFCSFSLFAQNLHSDTLLLQQLKEQVTYLASDKLAGRATGSAGEALAAAYIAQYFEQIGLEPKGTEQSFFQPFDVTNKQAYIGQNFLQIRQKKAQIHYKLQEDYVVLAVSGNGKVKGKTVFLGYGVDAPQIGYSDYAGRKNLKNKVFIFEWGHPKSSNAHTDYASHVNVSNKLNTAIARGAKAVIFIVSPNTEFNKDAFLEVGEKLKTGFASVSIPVLFLKNTNHLAALKEKQTSVNLQVSTKTTKVKGKNVIGFLDNKQQKTVVIGAHYDHLGHGESGNSLAPNSHEIHNGADDNASGVALMLSLAKYLKNTSNLQKNNYLFLAFSGEELGLYGSDFYTKHPKVPIAETNYMLNFDMVGCLDSINKTLIINGVGTSPQWSILDNINKDSLHITLNKSGIGPSDHTSFYWQQIPAIHFFTGAHQHYHRPTDDSERLNYKGMVSIMKYVIALLHRLNEEEKLTFTSTKAPKKQKAPKFTVTLGVMPNYAFTGEGMQINGIIDDRPAQQAGLQAKDVVVRLGEVKVTDMISYMKALSLLQKGDKTVVVVDRAGKTLTLDIQF